MGWLLTLLTGQVWLIPELRRILDKLDVALALLHGGLWDSKGLSSALGLLGSQATLFPGKRGSSKVAPLPLTPLKPLYLKTGGCYPGAEVQR